MRCQELQLYLDTRSRNTSVSRDLQTHGSWSSHCLEHNSDNHRVELLVTVTGRVGGESLFYVYENNSLGS